MKCRIARTEGGMWEQAELPKNIRGMLPTLSGAKPGDSRRHVDLREYGCGFVACVQLPNGDIYDPELLRYGMSGWLKPCGRSYGRDVHDK